MDLLPPIQQQQQQQQQKKKKTGSTKTNNNNKKKTLFFLADAPCPVRNITQRSQVVSRICRLVGQTFELTL